ncbi:MAG: hypothetical protein Q9171_005565 [Xanthocarpia ochracea]
MPTSNRSVSQTVRRSSAGQSSSSGSRRHRSSSKVDGSEHGSKRPLALPAIEEDAVSTHRGDGTGYHSRALVRRSSSNRGTSSTSELSNQLESLTIKGSSSRRSGKEPSSYKQSSSHRSSRHHKESSSHHSSKASTSHHRETDQALQRTSTAVPQSSRSMNGRSTHDGRSTHRDRSTRDDSHTRDDYQSRHASTRNEPSTRRYASTHSDDSPVRSIYVRSNSDSDPDLDLDIYGALSTDYATLFQLKSHRSPASWLAAYNNIDQEIERASEIESAYNEEVDRRVSEIESRLTGYSRVYRAALGDLQHSLTLDTSWFDDMLKGLSTENVKRYAYNWAEHLDVPKPRDYHGVRLYAGCWACHLIVKHLRAGAIRGSSSSSSRY